MYLRPQCHLCLDYHFTDAYRYPAVFWKTNKAIAFLFSVQLIGNGLQNLMAFSAMSIMYKVKKDHFGHFIDFFSPLVP